MSKCIKCGRELTTSEPIEMYNGMCTNCYWGSHMSARIVAIDDSSDDIAYGTFGKFKMLSEEEYDKLQTEIKQLKKQLKEKDKLIEFGRKEIRKRNRRIDEIVERDKKLFEDKNKEIESLNKRVDRYENMFRSRIARTGDIQKDIELYIKQLAINELAEV